MRAIRLPVLLALPLLVIGNAASAHKMKLFATAEGATVAGYAYFSPGGRAQDASVAAVTAEGTVVFRGRTDSDGTFRFVARQRTDHRITVDGADGHEAAFTVRATELPESLPAASPAGAGTPEPSAVAATAAATAAPPLAVAAAPADLALLVEQSVARQVRPLREQLDAFQEEARWHDVLGGLGSIIGLAGFAYGITARRKSRPQPRPVTAREAAAK